VIHYSATFLKTFALAISAFSLLYLAVAHASQQAMPQYGSTGSILIGIGALASPVMIFWLGVLQLSNTRKQDAFRRADEIARVEVANKVQLAAQAAREVARVAAETAQQAKQQADTVLRVTTDVHTLVNNQYGIALALIYEKATRIANMPGATDEDRAEVLKARQKLAEHDARQHIVDNPGGG
jgi:hypothetical protein